MVIDIARNVIELEASVVRDQLDALDAHFVRSIEILKEEMERVMQLIGCNSIEKLDASYVKKIK